LVNPKLVLSSMRIMAKEKEIIVTDVRDLIADHLKEIERDLAWLHRKTTIPYGTLYYSIVRKQFNISEVNLQKINAALETKFKNN
jgi:hypothetical protein